VPTPYPITIGYLVLTSTHELDVTAVYTSQACGLWATTGGTTLECLRADGLGTVSSSIDVEKVEGRTLVIPSGPEAATAVVTAPAGSK
jgi:hypothetical protein